MKLLLAVNISILFASGLLYASESKPKLSELSQIKVENLKLKTGLAQCNSTLASYSLTAEQGKLLGEFRKELNAKETDTFDWNSLSFSPVK